MLGYLKTNKQKTKGSLENQEKGRKKGPEWGPVFCPQPPASVQMAQGRGWDLCKEELLSAQECSQWVLLPLEAEHGHLCKWHQRAPEIVKVGVDTGAKETALWGFTWCAGSPCCSETWLWSVKRTWDRSVASTGPYRRVTFIWGKSWTLGSGEEKLAGFLKHPFFPRCILAKGMCHQYLQLILVTNWVASYFSSFLSLFRVRESIRMKAWGILWG